MIICYCFSWWNKNIKFTIITTGVVVSQCDMYWVDGQGDKRNPGGADGNNPNSVFVNTETPKPQGQEKQNATTNNNTKKTNTSTNANAANTNNNAKKNNASTVTTTLANTATQNNKANADPQSNDIPNTTTATSVVNDNTKTNTKPNTANDNTITNNADTTALNTNDNTQVDGAVMGNTGINGNNNDSVIGYDPNAAPTTDFGNNNTIDNNVNNAKLPNNKSSNVSPLLIGSLSIFAILLIVASFLYVKKRKRDENRKADIVYSNSVLYATPIISNASQHSKLSHSYSNYSYNNYTRSNDGEFDILIPPTKAVTDNHPAVTTQRTAPNDYLLLL